MKLLFIIRDGEITHRVLAEERPDGTLWSEGRPILTREGLASIGLSPAQAQQFVARRDWDRVRGAEMRLGHFGGVEAIWADEYNEREDEATLVAIQAKAKRLATLLRGFSVVEAAFATLVNARGDYDDARNRRGGYPAFEGQRFHDASDAYAGLTRQYPEAAAYLRAESYSQARNDMKAAAGARAMRRIEAGEAPLAVIEEMEREWSKAAEDAVWRA